MTTIGYATLQIIPSLRGVSDSINKELGKVDDGKKLGSNIGRNLSSEVGKGAENAAAQVGSRLSERLGAQVGSVIGKGIGGGISAAVKVGEFALKGALVGAAGAATLAVGGVGLALTKGFDRLKTIDDAKFKLKALGNDAGTVTQIMDSALASVKGTAFGLGDAATAAASAVAAGIKPGQDLTKYLSEVGDAAAVAGTSFEDMGSIFNKIQTQNKAYTDDLQQLSDRGLPIFTWLQQEYGVTADALSKMVQDGQVDAEHFQAAIDKHIGGAAKTMGQSFSGSVDNASAALGRLGAALLEPLFGNAAGGISGITDGLDKMTAWVNAHKPEIISFFTNIGVAAVSVAQDIVKSFASIVGAVGTLSTAFGTVLDGLGIDNDLTSIGNTLTGLETTLNNTAASWDTGKQKIREWGAAAGEAARNAQGANGAVTGLGTAVGALPFKKVIGIEADTKGAHDNVVGIGNAVAALHDKTITVNVKGQYSVSGQTSVNGTALPSFDGVTILPGGPLDSTGKKLPGGGASGPGKATGGLVTGPGGPTSDMIPTNLSDGEYVVNAEATRKNFSLLEAINGGNPSSSTSGGSGISLPSSFSGLASFGLNGLGSGVGKTGSGSDLSAFGNAAGAAVSGQISSLAGVFGAGDSPGWLQGISKLVGGISIGGSSAAPLSAESTATGTPPPDGMAHGLRAGQAPGPQTIFNIRTAEVDDAFLKAQRIQDVRLAAKMDRY